MYIKGEIIFGTGIKRETDKYRHIKNAHTYCSNVYTNSTLDQRIPERMILAFPPVVSWTQVSPRDKYSPPIVLHIQSDLSLIEYADDTALVTCLQHADSSSYCQDINSLVFWFDSSYMDLNIIKTKQLCLGGIMRAGNRGSNPTNQPITAWRARKWSRSETHCSQETPALQHQPAHPVQSLHITGWECPHE